MTEQSTGVQELVSSRELPRYRSHKVVHALRIKNVIIDTTGATIVPLEDGYPPFSVPLDYIAKHHPRLGGYFVQYADGYQSYSPAEAFESGYTLLTGDPSEGTEMPAFEHNMSIKEPSLYVDCKNVAWWIDPILQQIKKVEL